MYEEYCEAACKNTACIYNRINCFEEEVRFLPLENFCGGLDYVPIYSEDKEDTEPYL